MSYQGTWSRCWRRMGNISGCIDAKMSPLELGWLPTTLRDGMTQDLTPSREVEAVKVSFYYHIRSPLVKCCRCMRACNSKAPSVPGELTGTIEMATSITGLGCLATVALGNLVYPSNYSIFNPVSVTVATNLVGMQSHTTPMCFSVVKPSFPVYICCACVCVMWIFYRLLWYNHDLVWGRCKEEINFLPFGGRVVAGNRREMFSTRNVNELGQIRI